VRLLERQGFRARGEAEGPSGARVYEHEDGRTVIAQTLLPPCLRPGDRIFNLLAHDLRVTPTVLTRLFALVRSERG